MRPEFIAVLSAMGWAGDAVLVSIGARASNVVAAAFMSYAFAALALWTSLLVFFPLEQLGSRATIYFVLSGCLQPLLARILYYTGLTRIGVSRAGPLRGAEPLLSVSIAVLFLHERPSLFVYGGAALIVASVWLVLWRSEGEGQARLLDYFFPLGAALCGAVSQNLRKSGLLVLPDPYAGAAISTSTSLIIFAVFLLATGKIGLARPRRESLPFFGSAAVVSTGAQVLNYAALNGGDVSAMVPLLNTTPLFTVLFSVVFLRGVERVTLRVALGAILMVAGVAVIALRS
jgi:drug/metabolite transporter (DMT)-like permease